MAELITLEPDSAASECCSPETQQSCCEPSDKAACCDSNAAGGTCGCGAGQSLPADADELRETVRERYAAAALNTTDPITAAAAGRP